MIAATRLVNNTVSANMEQFSITLQRTKDNSPIQKALSLLRNMALYSEGTGGETTLCDKCGKIISGATSAPIIERDSKIKRILVSYIVSGAI